MCSVRSGVSLCPLRCASQLFPAEGAALKQSRPCGHRGEEFAKVVASALARLTELKVDELGLGLYGGLDAVYSSKQEGFYASTALYKLIFNLCLMPPSLDGNWKSFVGFFLNFNLIVAPFSFVP